MQTDIHSTKGSEPGGFALDESDVRRLMEDSSADARAYITDKIADKYKVDQLDRTALIAAEQVFRLLLQDTELKVRVTLAQHLKESAKIPRDIIKTLARDVEQVALPVLEFSTVFNDSDLIELLGATQEISRYLAVSKRREVSEKVSMTLLETGNPQVATTLVHNSGAKISDEGFNLLIDKHKDNETLMKSVGTHPKLPLVAVEKLVHVVSASLAETLRKKHNLPAGQIAQEIDQTHEEQTLALITYARSEDDIDKLISQLRLSNRLTPSLILSALCGGNFDFFEHSLARLSNIPLANARKLIADRGDLGFRAIYNKAGLPEGLFRAVKMLLYVLRDLNTEGIKPGSPKFSSYIVERILHHADQSPVENLSYIIALVRRVAR